MNNKTKDVSCLKTPTLHQKSPKQSTPRISVKQEFNTDLSQKPIDDTDQPEILKYTKDGANLFIPQPTNTLHLSTHIHSCFPG